MASPRPEPPRSRERDLSARQKRSKTWGRSSGGMPSPVSAMTMRIAGGPSTLRPFDFAQGRLCSGQATGSGRRSGWVVRRAGPSAVLRAGVGGSTVALTAICPPSGVWCRALERRLRMICARRSGSARTGRLVVSSARSVVSLTPLASAATLKFATVVWTTSTRSVGRRSRHYCGTGGAVGLPRPGPVGAGRPLCDIVGCRGTFSTLPAS